MKPTLKTNSKLTYHIYTTLEHSMFAYALKSPEQLWGSGSPCSLFTAQQVIFPSESYQEIH